jgi:hypothetical protein
MVSNGTCGYGFIRNLWRKYTMKMLAYTALAASLLAAPIASFAQSTNEPMTRAQVRQQLIEIEQAGYNPAASNDYNYPADIQAAEARVATQKEAAQPGSSAYGPAMNGSAQSGEKTMAPAASPAIGGQ